MRRRDNAENGKDHRIIDHGWTDEKYRGVDYGLDDPREMSLGHTSTGTKI